MAKPSSSEPTLSDKTTDQPRRPLRIAESIGGGLHGVAELASVAGALVVLGLITQGQLHSYVLDVIEWSRLNATTLQQTAAGLILLWLILSWNYRLFGQIVQVPFMLMAIGILAILCFYGLVELTPGGNNYVLAAAGFSILLAMAFGYVRTNRLIIQLGQLIVLATAAVGMFRTVSANEASFHHSIDGFLRVIGNYSSC